MKRDQIGHKNSSELLRRVHASLLRKIEKGLLLSMSDLSDLRKLPNLCGVNFLLLQGDRDRRVRTPALSFKVTAENVEKIPRTGQHGDKQQNILEELGYLISFQSRHYIIATNHHPSNINLANLAKLLDLFYENSIIKINIDQDKLNDIALKIRATRIGSREKRKSVLVDSVMDFTSLKSNIYQVNNDDIQAHSYHRFPEISKKIKNEVQHFIQTTQKGPTKNIISGFSESLDKKYYTSLSADSPQKALIDCINTFKPQYFEIKHQGKIYKYFAFPLSVKEPTAYTAPSRPREILVAESISGFSRRNLQVIQLLISGYIDDETLASRLRTLEEADQNLRTMELKISEQLNTYSLLAEEFRAYSSWICKQVINTTSAYSVTVRLFDHSSRSLRLIASSSDSEGEHQEPDRHQEINVKKHSSRSVNAFVFNNWSAIENNAIYLPKISKQPSKNDIPMEYRVAGLHGIIKARPNTRSEMCLAILSNTIPVGTINIESPIKNAFDGLSDYFFAIRRYIQKAYAASYGYTDIRNLSTQVSNHAAVHELDQHLSLPDSIFSENQRELLSKLFLLRELDSPIETSLSISIYQWIEHAYRHLEVESRHELFQLLKIRSLSENNLSPSAIIGIRFIVKNLLQNIMTHSSIDKRDGGIVLIDDTPFGSLIARTHLRIYCKQQPIRNPEILDRAGISPILSSEGGARHGLLLISMIAKALGGTAAFTRDINAKFTEILITIPYERQK